MVKGPQQTSFLRFGEYQCIVDVSFWDVIIKLKLNKWKLATDCVPLTGYLQAPNVLRINGRSVDDTQDGSDGHCVHGAFYHANSWEEFCSLTFNDLALQTLAPLKCRVLENAGDQPRDQLAPINLSELLVPFTVVAYMDLKEYVMRYAVSIGTVGSARFQVVQYEEKEGINDPSRVRSAPIVVHSVDEGLHSITLHDLSPINILARNAMLALCPLDGTQFVLKKLSPDLQKWQIYTLRAIIEEDGAATSPVIAGWLRRKTIKPHEAIPGVFHLPNNCIFQLNLQVVQQNATELNVRLIKWRIIPEFDPKLIQCLRVLVIGMGTLGCLVCRELIGWGVRQFTLIDCGVVAPSNPARQCLYISSDVVNNSTVRDDEIGETYQDHRNYRKCKVHVAKSRLLEIRPDLDVQALDWEIPMPNQSRFNLPVKSFIPDCSPNEAEEVYSEWITRRLMKLIDEHHVVWLLTDNRESRWLPGLITQHLSYTMAVEKDQPDLENINPTDSNMPEMTTGEEAATAPRKSCTPGAFPPVEVNRKPNPFYPPLCYTVALGFDTFVAMRHGTYADASVADEFRDVNSPYDVFGGRLSCYFCNDLSAPGPTSAARALDQQCTVTRAGVAGWAAALAVEAVAAMTQADYAWGCAPPDRILEAKIKLAGVSQEKSRHIRKWMTENPRHKSCLGDSPHVIRGSLGTFNLAHNWHPAFPHCVCCGVNVQKAFCQYGEK